MVYVPGLGVVVLGVDGLAEPGGVVDALLELGALLLHLVVAVDDVELLELVLHFPLDLALEELLGELHALLAEVEGRLLRLG